MPYHNICTRAEKDILISKYGKDFSNQYGWAAEALGNSRPNILDIEKNVGLDHLRPYYKLASHAVHSNSKGLLFNIGLSNNANILLAGPSNEGLVDPGHGAAISLHQVSVALLMIDPTLLGNSFMMAGLTIVDEIGEKFLEVENRGNLNKE